MNNNTPIVQNRHTAPDSIAAKIAEKKIGRATFIVTSRFSDGKEKDLVSTIARLIQLESGEGKPA